MYCKIGPCFNKLGKKPWEDNQKILYKAKAKKLAVLTGHVLNGNFLLPTAMADPSNSEKYEQMSSHLFGLFSHATAEATFRRGNIAHGFNVCGRIAYFGCLAYQERIKRSGHNGSAGALGEILQNSYDPAVTIFSSLPGSINAIYEHSFGLTTRRVPSYEPYPFEVTDSVEGELAKLVPSRETLCQTMRETYRMGLSTADHQLTERCPASGIMLQKVWKATIRACVANQHLFPADIAATNQQIL